MKLLEQHNPDVQFDWVRLLKESSVPDAAPRRERDDRIRERRERRDQRPPQRPPRPQTSAAAAPPLAPPSAELAAERDAAHQRAEEHAEHATQRAAASGDTAEPGHAADPLDALDATEPFEPPSPANDRLGAAGVARLRARYLDVVARLVEKEDLEEPARIELKRSAERLNPDGWHTPEEVAAALEGYEAVFEYLRSVVGRHTRRPK